MINQPQGTNFNKEFLPTYSKYLSMSPSCEQKPKKAAQDTLELRKNETSVQDAKESTTDKKKSKRILIATASLVAAGGLTALGVIAGNGKYNKKLMKLLKGKAKGQTIGEDILNFTKLKESIKAGTKDKRVLSISNFMNNMSNFKDCYILPVLEKIPLLGRLAQKSSDIYTKTGVEMTKAAYKNALGSYQSFDFAIKQVLEELGNGDLKKQVLELIQERNKTLEASFSPELIEKFVGGKRGGRIVSIEKIMESVGEKGICRETRAKFNELLERAVKSKGRDTAGWGEFVAENLVKEQKAQYISKLEVSRNIVDDIDSKILEMLKAGNNDGLAEEVMENLSRRRTCAMGSLNHAIRTEGNDLFDKIRDVKIGSAPTDVLSMLSSAGFLGLYLAQAEDKNQRVEAALTTGLPLGLGMLATTFATMKMYTGIKAIGFGAITTFISNTIGKVINKKYQESHNVQPQELDIPTLDKTVEDFKEKIKTPKV